MNLLLNILLTMSINANATDGISSNHQVNPPHEFHKLVCIEEKNKGRFGYTIVIDVPNGRDALAQVYFNRPSEKKILVSAWVVKYIVNPSMYAVFTNHYQYMDISKGPDDLISLAIQLHSGNGSNGTYIAEFTCPLLLGFEKSGYYGVEQPADKLMLCRFTN